MKQYEVIVPIYWDQLKTISWSVEYIEKNLNPLRIIFVGPSEIKKHLNLEGDKVCFIDGNVIWDGMNKDSIAGIIKNVLSRESLPVRKNRAGWYLQQFIKMGYAYYTKEDGYMVWDGDSVPVQKISLWDDDKKKKIMALGAKHQHMEYYETMSTIFGKKIQPMREETFVVPYMLFDTKIMINMLEKISENKLLQGNSWWEKILYAINSKDIEESGFSEFETYGVFAENYFPDTYLYRDNIAQSINAKKLLGEMPNMKTLEWAGQYYKILIFEARDIPSKSWMALCKCMKRFIPYYNIVRAEIFLGKLSWNSLRERGKRFKRNLKKGMFA